MNSPLTTVFDLIPAKKLQLVEALWDDLTANPDSVPIHKWQKEELLRRKIAFEPDPSTPMNWKETKLWIRVHNDRLTNTAFSFLNSNIMMNTEKAIDLTN